MAEAQPPAIEIRHLNLWYGSLHALREVELSIPQHRITALIGPSGCGKSTLLRSINRIGERDPAVRSSGQIRVFGEEIFGANVELAQLRKQIGMVFQRPNPLPISIRENVLFGHRLHQPNQARRPSQQQALLEDALRTVQLWDEVKDRLDQSPATLTLEQQQKLCIARLLPVKPRLLLMDEPCSTLDPQGTAAVEELIWQLRGKYTIFLVTHDMAQARRISEECIFMLAGQALEHQQTDSLFITPRCRETTDYIEGKYG